MLVVHICELKALPWVSSPSVLKTQVPSSTEWTCVRNRQASQEREQFSLSVEPQPVPKSVAKNQTITASLCSFHSQALRGVSNLLASLGHNGRRVGLHIKHMCLGLNIITKKSHGLNIITKKSHVLSKFMILCLATFIPILGLHAARHPWKFPTFGKGYVASFIVKVKPGRPTILLKQENREGSPSLITMVTASQLHCDNQQQNANSGFHAQLFCLMVVLPAVTFPAHCCLFNPNYYFSIL